MKFVLVVMLALSVLVLLVAAMACSNDSDDTPRPMVQPTSTPSAATMPESAVALSMSETVEGNLSDGDDKDYFRISREGNRVYDLSVVPGTLTTPMVILRTSDMSRVMEGRGHPDTGEVRFVWPGYAKDYYVTVEGGDGGGTYTLTLAPFPEDHGDDIPFATKANLGETLSGSIGYRHDFDYFSFSADVGQLYRVEVATSNRGCWIMRLNDSDDEILAFKSFSGNKGLIIWEATNSGDHYVEVSNGGTHPGCNSWEGEYTLTVAPMSRPPEDEHGNGVRSAASLEVGESVDASLEYAGDQDYFQFRAEKGRIYRMDVVLGTLDSYNYEIRLYGPDGDEIEWSPYGHNELAYAWEAPATGGYYVAIAASGNQTGSYTLRVTPIDDEYGEGPTSATEVTLGEPIRGSTQYLGGP